MKNQNIKNHPNLFHIHENKKVQTGNFNLIFLNSQDKIIEGVGGSISNTTIRWLEKSIYDSKCNLIFAHHAIMTQELDQNPHFKNIKNLGYIEQKENLINIFNKHEGVKLIFNGHLHWTDIKIGKQTYIFHSLFYRSLARRDNS